MAVKSSLLSLVPGDLALELQIGPATHLHRGPLPQLPKVLLYFLLFVCCYTTHLYWTGYEPPFSTTGITADY